MSSASAAYFGSRLQALRGLRPRPERYCGKPSAPTTTRPPMPRPYLGGYSQRIVVDRDFVLKVRHPGSQLAAVAPPLCCARASPPIRRCMHWERGPSKEGRHRRHRRARPHGHQIAHAMGLTTWSRSPAIEAQGKARKLGADGSSFPKDAAQICARRRAAISSSTPSPPPRTWIVHRPAQSAAALMPGQLLEPLQPNVMGPLRPQGDRRL